MSHKAITIRAATSADAATIVHLIRELASFEGLLDAEYRVRLRVAAMMLAQSAER